MKVQYYVTAEGKEPFTKWLSRLRDKVAHAAILKRIARIRLNLFGDTRSVGGGVHEIRVDVGVGYRVYFAHSGNDVVLLLCGGDKDTQDADIIRAKDFWKDYKKANE
jgi:putative addiction module killer protein